MQKNEPLPLAVSPDVAAQLLSISRPTIDREVARGRLHAVKIGCATRIKTSEIERYLSELPARGRAPSVAEDEA